MGKKFYVSAAKGFLSLFYLLLYLALLEKNKTPIPNDHSGKNDCEKVSIGLFDFLSSKLYICIYSYLTYMENYFGFFNVRNLMKNFTF